MIGKLLCKIGWHKLIFKYRMAVTEATVVQCQRCRTAFVRLDNHPAVKLTMTEWKNRERGTPQRER